MMERGECDLETIVEKLIEKDRFTPAKIRYYWEEMLEALKSGDKAENNFSLAALKPRAG